MTVPPGDGRAFQALPGLARLRDQRDLMGRPFFSLSKSPRVGPVRHAAGDAVVEVAGLPGVGMATIWDADVLLWAGSQVVEALDHGLVPQRRIRFTPYQLLAELGRPPGQRQYLLLRGALRRLQSTVVRTSIRQGGSRRLRQFGWLDEWGELLDAGGRVRGMELVLADWFWHGVLDRSRVLTIDPAYLRLSGGLERWLYRLARRHAGRQQGGWTFEVAHLRERCGSTARPADFALALRRAAAAQPLPDYRLAVEEGPGGGLLLVVRPVGKPVGKPVDKPVDGMCDTSVHHTQPLSVHHTSDYPYITRAKGT